MIEGVKVKILRPIPDERGRLMEILREDDEMFERFGQAYITTAYPGVVKAWHFHEQQDDHFCVVHGMMKVVLHDERPDSTTTGETNEFFMGDRNPMLIKIPRFVWHGFKCIGEHEAVCLNMPTKPYNYEAPDEIRTVPFPPSEKGWAFGYDWRRKDG